MPTMIPGHWTLRTLIGRSPMLFDAVFALVNDRSRLVAADTDLVVEGFPRSGNSFSVSAMTAVQERPLRIAHHVHSPSQIISAARRRIPAILLFRDPADAVAAALAKSATLRAADLLRAYAIYYGALLPLRRHFVAAPFATVTADFGRIVDAVNLKFDTRYPAIDALRHADLSRNFLAREKFEGFAAPASQREIDAVAAHADLLEGARDIHRRIQECAREDGTSRPH